MSEFLSKVRKRFGRKSSQIGEGILPLYDTQQSRSAAAAIVGALELNELIGGQSPTQQRRELSGVVMMMAQAGGGASSSPPLSTEPSPSIRDDRLPPPPRSPPPPPPPSSPTTGDAEVAAAAAASDKLRLTHIEHFLDTSRDRGLTLTAGKTENEPRTTRTCRALRQAIFWTFMTTSLAQGLKSSKYSGLNFLQQRNLANFLDFSNFTMLFVVGLSFIIFFLIKEQALTRFRKALRRRKEEDPEYNPTSDTMVKWTVGIFQATSLLTAVFAQLESGKPLSNWTPDSVMYYHAYHFAMGLFWWDSGKSDDTVDFVRENYAGSPSGTRTAFVVANICLAFSAFLMLSLLRDLLDTLAITMFYETRRAAQLCKIQDNEIVDEATAKVQVRATLSSKLLSDEYNKCFRGELKLVIIMELFAWTYFLQEQLDDEIFFILALMLSVNALKTLLFFILSVMTNKYGKKCHRAMERLSRKYKVLEVDGRMVRIDLLVDDLASKPIAIGRGAFQITEAFFLAFLTSVWTFFTIVAQAKGKAGPSIL